MNTQMSSRRSRIWFAIIGLVMIAGILAGVWAFYNFEIITSQPFNPFIPRQIQPVNPADLEFYYIARTAFSTVNIALLIILTETYAALYYKTRSQFTIGLLLFALVFLMKEITTSPFVTGVFRFNVSGLGPFALIEPLLETAALSVLLYLSIEY
jgi:hypothetical protein